MSYIRGTTPIVWNMEEVARLDYFHEPFNDKDTTERWQKIYNRDFSIGAQADYRSAQPTCQVLIGEDLARQGIRLSHIGFSWYRMLPGDIIPEHGDTYASYARYHQVDAASVVRILVLLENWQPGHLLEVDGDAIVAYPAGTWVMWRANTLHMAGNIGHTPRYTLQITGIINENSSIT